MSSKKSSKKNSKKTSKKNSKTKVKYKTKIYVDNNSDDSSFLNLADHQVYQIIKSYRDVYEFITHKSLEYKIEITPLNQSLGETNVIYFKLGMYGYNTNPNINTKMHIVGYLDGNTWTWNPYQINRHYNVFLKYVSPLIYNKNAILSLNKLFQYNQITFPEKYRMTIPYLLSYMYEPKKANIIRFSDNLLSNHSFTFAYIEMDLDIPYWYEMTDHIAKQLNYISYGGSKKKTSENMRLIKNDTKSHKTNMFLNIKKDLIEGIKELKN